MVTNETELIVKKAGLRNTKVRKLCISQFLSATGPIDATLLIDKLQVNKTTVYRELATLVSKGILSEIDFGDGKKRYELSTLSHHHHLVCVKCKSVSEYKVETDLSLEEKNIQRNFSFTVQKHTLEFFGICRSCTAL